jgi:hypothetical protein
VTCCAFAVSAPKNMEITTIDTSSLGIKRNKGNKLNCDITTKKQ